MDSDCPLAWEQMHRPFPDTSLKSSIAFPVVIDWETIHSEVLLNEPHGLPVFVFVPSTIFFQDGPTLFSV